MIVDVAGAAAALQAADDILILTHRRPDGDTAGCAGALCRGLQQIGKRAYILENPEITRRYAPLIVPYYPPEDFVPAYVVSTDIAEEKLFPDTAEPYKGKVDLVIDHHGSNDGFGKKNLIRPDAGGCAEVLYDVLTALGVKFTADIAECIYIGVSTDTGCFKFSNTTAHSHAVAAACLTAGIDGGEINRVLFETKSRPRFEMERIVFDTMEFHENGAIAVAVLWRRDIDHAGADMDDLDSIASLTRQIEGVQIGITLTEKPDGTVRVSVRTTKEMDAAAICKKVGGGGHVRAAGASFTCGMAEAKAAMLKATGVLPVFVGGATKAADFAAAQDKEYVAGFTLGYCTDTQDVTGEMLQTSERYAAEYAVKQMVRRFIGPQQQVPPMYSAVKVNGQKLYDLARKGREVERPARDIIVHEIDLLDFDENAQKGTLRCKVSKGTYVRTLVNDLGEKLGTLAVLHSLERTRSGAYELAQCHTFAECEQAMAEGTMQQLLLPTDSLFTDRPAVSLTDEGAERIARGAVVFPRQTDSLPETADTICRVYHQDKFLMLGQVRELDKGGLGLFVYKNFR